MKTNRTNRRRPTLERLEEKNLFAGLVTAEVSDGVLEISGDHLNNQVEVFQAGDWMVVQGQDGTRVNRMVFRPDGWNNPNESFQSVNIDMGRGSDTLLVRDLDLDGRLDVISGHGQDQVEVRDSRLDNVNIQEESNSWWYSTPYSDATLKLNNVTADSYISAQSTWIDADDLSTSRNGAIFLKGAFVDADDVTTNGLFVYNDAGTSSSNIDLLRITAQRLDVDTSNGNDTVRLASSSIATNILLDTGTSGFSGYDRIYVSGTTVGRDLTINAGQGTDKQGSYMNLSTNQIGGDLRVTSGAGDDTVVISSSKVGDLLALDTRGGDDTAIVISSTLRNDLTLKMGEGDDYFNLFNSTLSDNLSAYMGSGDDTLRISGSTVGRAYVNGESGSRDYLQLVDAAFGQLNHKGFERFFFD